MPENALRFTKTAIENLPLPESERAVWRDTEEPGLICRVTAAGSKGFYFYRKVAGRPERLLLGKWPTMTVKQARDACRKKSGEAASGKSPAAERRTARHEQTVAGMFAFWLQHAKGHKKTWPEDERQYEAFLKPWAARKLSTVKRADVQALHARVGEKNGPYAANRLLALMRAMFNRAADMGFTGPNPAAGVNKFPEEKRDRFLHGDELRAFFLALDAEPNQTIRDFFMVALLTGARKTNVLAMAWADVDMQLGIWRIPETKAGRPVVVPITSACLEILTRRKAIANGSPWVFPSFGKTGHLVEPKAAWRAMVKRAGLEDVRPHDLRRSLGSWMAISGASLPVVGKMLGHSQPNTTAVYARLTVDPVREAAETATAAMLGHAKNGGPANGEATK